MRDFLAIDPGDVHNGVAYFTCLDRRLIRHWTRDLKRDTLFGLVETAVVDGFVIEEFRLYPELAREQGYSDFPTVEVIGVVKYLARKRDLPCVVQGASIKSKSRRIGERLDPNKGRIRSLGTGRGTRRGWDWDAPTQHERDATSHGTWFALRGKDSPLFERDYAKNGGVVFEW